jgi:sentrin-specific protease 1
VVDSLRTSQVPSPCRDKQAQLLVHLTDRQCEVVALAMVDDQNTVVAKLGNADVTGRHMQCLRDGEWLNDDIINAYVTLLNMQLQESDPSVFIANTFWVAKFGSKKFDAQAFSRFLKRSHIESEKLTKLILPVHVENNHWCLPSIDIPIRRLATARDIWT